ncbi:glycoside hydrolase family 15 protein [Streptomyces bambusae]|uniref:hypothetical protein n=1 Tax=Streptomyces bambusae TaxID=1550616 RepID=UPI0021F59F56|nr:hypothetical protein [Streptomyces bambusae]
MRPHSAVSRSVSAYHGATYAAYATLSAVLAASLLGAGPGLRPAHPAGPARPAAGPAPLRAAAAVYDRQANHETALFSITADNNAAAQEFTTADTKITRVGLYLSSAAASGTLTVQIRTQRDRSASAVATATADLAALGGAGTGWLELALNAAVRPGTRYYLHARATTPAGAQVRWYGTLAATPGSLTAWNYDKAYWGGWHAYDSRLAFHINPAGAARCGETEQCFVPATALKARTSGVLSNLTATEGVLPQFAVGAVYLEGSHVLRLPSGRWRYLPAGAAKSVVVPAGDPSAWQQIDASRAWLAAGTVPGSGAARATAARALLAMRALLQSNGSFAAGWSPPWEYSWPRDSSFAAVAFAHTGHDEEAYRILRYNATTQRADGTWEARTKLDGSGPPDARRWQLDANGWLPWATWQWYRTAPADTRNTRLAALYPMIGKAADHAAASLDANGLPPASPDYWELMATTVTIGTAAPLLSGLNAAADLALVLGRTADADRWSAAARRLSAGIADRFAPLGYQRTIDGAHGRDSAAAFMAPPFNAAPPDLPAALDETWQALLLPNGGLRPGDDPDHAWSNSAWTASTSFFALAWLHLGQRDKGNRVLDYVLGTQNHLGELPETVTDKGFPSQVAPLGWTDSLVLLALLARDGSPLATPPLRPAPAAPAVPDPAVPAPDPTGAPDPGETPGPDLMQVTTPR